MTDDYLWDGSGEPDPEVQRLERLLERFRQGSGAVEATSTSTSTSAPFPWGRPERSRPLSRRRVVRFVGAIAATIIVAVAGIAFLRRGVLSPAGGGWEVVTLAGEPTIASRRLATSGTLLPGEWIETDDTSRAEIKIGRIGTAEIEPRTRVRLLQAGTLQHRIGLTRGTVHARIWAPPRLFFIETPSAVVVDLGCAYTLTVDDEGGSRLRVESGWVAFEDGGVESFVPAGAVCRTSPGHPPGTPYFEDAAPTFVAALSEIDAAYADTPIARSRGSRLAEDAAPATSPGAHGETGPMTGMGTGAETSCSTGMDGSAGVGGGTGSGTGAGKGAGVGEGTGRGTGAGAGVGVGRGTGRGTGPGTGDAAVAKLLDAARPRDALTLWHLLSRTTQDDRARLFDRMAQLVPPPAGVTCEGVVAGDRRMADLWWDELGLGVTSWWRLWKQSGPPRVE